VSAAADTLQLLAEEIYLGEVDQLIAATADHRFEHEHPEAGGLFDGDCLAASKVPGDGFSRLR
jgi:hypothetical protein